MKTDTARPAALDALDLRLLHALDVAGRAPFARIAEVLGVSDQTVARRYRRLRAEAGLRVVGVRDTMGLGEDSWMLRLRCTPDAAEALARALARRPGTAWIAIASGGTEVIGMTVPRTEGERDELLLGRLPRTPSITGIRAHQLLHRFFGGPGGWLAKRQALTPDEIAALATPPGPPGPPVSPDDAPLLDALAADGRATVEELRRATGRPESTVRRRLEQLQSSGALFIDVQLDTHALGYTTRALLWITASPAALDRVGRALATHPEVAFAAATAGASNLVAVIVCENVSAIYPYLSERVGTLEGVEHIDCTPVLRTVKQLTYEEARR
ncbi:AsnC family transcriptional regulator [Streptomyces sp. NPDC001941]|uniref:AsnC family transcriptional regulator n=1 Tax=Streptomyces sp. NPDC001941 TaxID=3154659 RepID=UPI0033169BF5